MVVVAVSLMHLGLIAFSGCALAGYVGLWCIAGAAILDKHEENPYGFWPLAFILLLIFGAIGLVFGCAFVGTLWSLT